MKKAFFFFTSVGLFLFVLGCPNPTGDSTKPPNPSSNVVGVSTKNGKSLFLCTQELPQNSSKAIRSKDAASFATISSVLTTLDAFGNPQLVVFRTDDGGQAVLNITNINVLSPTLIGFDFNEVITVESTQTVTVNGQEESLAVTGITQVAKTALADMNTGTFYDFTGYHLTRESAGVSCPALVWNGFLYVTSNTKTVYKIDLSNISSAVPLNNSAFTPIDQLYYVTPSGKLVAGSNYYLDINGVLPPATYKTFFSPDPWKPGVAETLSTTPSPVMIDSNGSIWTYDINPTAGQYCVYQLSMDDSGNLTSSNFTRAPIPSNPFSGISCSSLFPCSAKDTTRYIAGLLAGLAKIQVQPTGGISLSFYPYTNFGQSSFSNSAYYGSYSRSTNSAYGITGYFINNTFYWMQNYLAQMSLLSTTLDSSNTLSVVYTNPGLVAGSGYNAYQYPLPAFGYSNGDFILYQYVNAFTVGTYSLPIGQSALTLLATNQIGANNIVRLSF